MCKVKCLGENRSSIKEDPVLFLSPCNINTSPQVGHEVVLSPVLIGLEGNLSSRELMSWLNLLTK